MALPAIGLAGSIAGGALSGAAGKKTKTTTNATTVAEPYKPTIPYLDEILSSSQALYQANPRPSFGPSAVPNASAQTTAAQKQITDLSKTPTGLIPAAQTAVQNTISGNYLNSSPGTAALAGIAGGGSQNPATGMAGQLAGGYNDPAMGFNNALMRQGYNDPSQALYGQMAGAQAGDNSSGLFGQASGMQAQSLGNPYFTAAGGQTAGQGATDMYGQLAGTQANTSALGQYANIGGTRTNADATGVYSGMANGSDPNSQVFNEFAQGNFNQGANTYEQLANRQYTDPSSAAMADYLTPFANGSLSDVNSNPYLQGMLDIQSRRISDSVNSMFGAGNRYGSGANQQVLGREIGDAATQMLGSAYENNMGRQLSAAGQMAGIGENRASRDLQAMSTGAAGMEAQRLNNLGQQFQGAQAGVNSALAGAQGLQSADQFGLNAALAGAQGQQGINQFADQFGASNLAQGASGIQNQGQFSDQFNQNALLNAGSALQASGQNADAFNLQALLSGAQGLQGNQQFSDQFGLNALNQGAAGLGTGAANQIQAQTGAANALSVGAGNQFQSALSGTGLQAQIGQQNIGNVMGAAGALNDAYSRERENMLNATNNAAPLDQARYLDSQMLGQVGAQKDALAAAKAAEAQARFQYENNQAPYAALDQYLNTVGSIAGLGGTKTLNGTSVTKEGGGLLSGIAGGIGGGLSGLGAMSSGMGSGGAGMAGMSSGFSQFMPSMGGMSQGGMGYNPFSLMNYGTTPMSSYGGNTLSLR
jgi:hypothetical protein